MPSDEQKARTIILRTVLAAPTVTDLISNRFYPGGPGTFVPTAYPCACFRLGSGPVDPDLEQYKQPSLSIWVWSKKSYTEDYPIYNAIFAVLHNQLLTLDDRAVVCKADSTPIEAFEPAENTFYLNASWGIRMMDYS